MDLSWIATAVAAIAGTVSTIWVHRSAQNEARGREERLATRADRADKAEQAGRKRDAEMPNVLRLHDEFLRIRIAVDQDDPDDRPFEDRVLATWADQYYASVMDAERVSDSTTRRALQDCLTAIAGAGQYQRMPGWGSVDEIARNNAGLGLLIVGAWLRGDPLDDSTAARLASTRRMIAKWDEEQERRIQGR